MSELRRADAEPMVAVTQETMKQLADRPLLAVPPELRPAVFQAWAVYRHLAGFDTPAPIAFAVSLWINQHGYPPDAVRAALVAVTGPLLMRKVRFASDFTAALADLLEPDTMERLVARIEADRVRREGSA